MDMKGKKPVRKRKPFGGKSFLPQHLSDLQIMCSWDEPSVMWSDKEYNDELWIIPADFFKHECQDRVVESQFLMSKAEAWKRPAFAWTSFLTVSGKRASLEDRNDFCRSRNREMKGEHGCVEIEFEDENRAKVKHIEYLYENDRRWTQGFACSWKPADLTEFLEGKEREPLKYLVDARQDQQEFHKRLIDAYGERCCVTEYDVVEGLEAAHVKPFKERGANDITNGLLLRSDIHKLFDRGLLAFQPLGGKARIHLSKTLRDGRSKYSNLHGQVIEIREKVEKALGEHFDVWVAAQEGG